MQRDGLVYVEDSLVCSDMFVPETMAYLLGSVAEVTSVDPDDYLDVSINSWWIQSMHVVKVPSNSNVLYLLTSGKMDCDQVNIIGLYTERPRELTAESLGVTPGGTHYKALAISIGVTEEILEEQYELKNCVDGMLVYSRLGQDCIGEVRLVGVLDGKPYLVSNSYFLSNKVGLCEELIQNEDGDDHEF